MNGATVASSRTATRAARLLPAAILAATLLAVAIIPCALPALAIEKKPAKMWDDLSDLKVEAFRIEEPEWSLYDCWLQYHYYIPCLTYSWFWAYSGWEPGDIIGTSFTIGDQPTGGDGGWWCDPYLCQEFEGVQLLDFAGYGTVYPGLFTFELDIYYVDTTGAPGCNIWNSGPLESHFGWNYFEIRPPVALDICPDFCSPWEQGCPYPTILLTMTMTGAEGTYPAIGFDNVSTPAGQGCAMHDIGCLPALYPRNGPGGQEPRVRSGYLGNSGFDHWPPRPIPDGRHATRPSGAQWYGFVEPAWRVNVICYGPSAAQKQAQPATWGAIKSLYK
jgi:hypothetical protein